MTIVMMLLVKVIFQRTKRMIKKKKIHLADMIFLIMINLYFNIIMLFILYRIHAIYNFPLAMAIINSKFTLCGRYLLLPRNYFFEELLKNEPMIIALTATIPPVINIPIIPSNKNRYKLKIILKKK
jgi:hypothetical protein